MPYDLNIPGWMPEAELRILEKLAQAIPVNGAMVEVGPFLGRSSWCWAKSADPSVSVYCLDMWNPAAHPYHPPSTIGEKTASQHDFGVADSLDQLYVTIDNFKQNTRDCPNIIPLQGASPQDFLDWNLPVDLVFLDGLHHNPGFWEDMNFWFHHIKPGGIFCGDDCARTHPDVLWSVHDFAKTHNLPFLVEGRIWMLPVPPHRDVIPSLFGKAR
jgi:hypothetical protein